MSEPELLRHEEFFVTRTLQEARAAKAHTDGQFTQAIDDMSAGEWAPDDPGVLQAAQAARVSDSRVEAIQNIVGKANLPYPSLDSDSVAVGSRVTVSVEGDDDETFDVTSRFISGMPRDGEAGVELLSAQTDLGRSLLGKKVGETFLWRTPNGALNGLVRALDQLAQARFYAQFLPQEEQEASLSAAVTADQEG